MRELLLAGRRRTRTVMLARGSDQSSILGHIAELAREQRAVVREMSRAALAAAARTESPQGVVALADPLPEVALEELLTAHPVAAEGRGANSGTTSALPTAAGGIEQAAASRGPLDPHQPHALAAGRMLGDAAASRGPLDPHQPHFRPAAGGAQQSAEAGGAQQAAEARVPRAQGGLRDRPAAGGARQAAEGRGGRSGRPFLLVLDGITDPGNFGAVLRTAECAGVTGVVLPRHRSARVTPTVAKAAAGAVEHLRLAVVPGIPSALRTLSNHDVWTVGLDPGGPRAFHELGLSAEAVALVLGSEGKGLSRLVAQRCDVLASIPQRGVLGSLNVAAAAAVACFEIARHRPH